MRGVTCQGEYPLQVKTALQGEVFQSKSTLHRRTNHLISVTGQRKDPILEKFTPQGEICLGGKANVLRRAAQLKWVSQQSTLCC